MYINTNGILFCFVLYTCHKVLFLFILNNPTMFSLTQKKNDNFHYRNIRLITRKIFKGPKFHNGHSEILWGFGRTTCSTLRRHSVEDFLVSNLVSKPPIFLKSVFKVQHKILIQAIDKAKYNDLALEVGKILKKFNRYY